MTTKDEYKKLREEQNVSHEETLRVLQETDQSIASAQTVLSEARKKLKAAAQRYEERLYGPKSFRAD